MTNIHLLSCFKERKGNIKRNVIVFIISLLVSGAFALGVKVGKRRVIDNQVIFDGNNEEGSIIVNTMETSINIGMNNKEG